MEVLAEKLWNYIIDNNPDLMFKLQEDYSVMKYLKEKIEGIKPLVQKLTEEGRPEYIIQEICMEELTAELKPSRFNYIKEVLEAEFEKKTAALRESGTLTYEIINIMGICEEAFTAFEFSEENQQGRFLRYAVTGKIDEYLNREEDQI